MKRKEKRESETGFEPWGDYMDAKIAKLEDQYRQSSSNVGEKLSNLFAGISIFVNGYTNPSADELKLIMMQHGGVFHHYKRPNTTYTIASILPDVKVRSITSEIIISPRWVVDCLSEGKILDYSRYLLYTQHKPSQPKLAFAKIATPMIGSAGHGGRSDADVAKPVPKRDNDPNDISRAECLNVLGMLRHFGDQEQNRTNSEKQAVQPSTNADSVQSTTETKTEAHATACEEPTTGTEVLQQPAFNLSPEVFETSSHEVEEDVPAVVPAKASPQKPPSTKQSLTATDPNFLAEFFNNSRLHHIATLGASFKQYVVELREKSTGSFPAREILVDNLPRRDDAQCEGEGEGDFSGAVNQHYIMHIDMDCFFVSVGLRNHPHLRGLPVAVTHSRGSEARVPTHPGQNRALEIELYQKRLGERYKTPDIPIESRLSSIDENNSLSEIASCSYEARRCGVKNGMFVGAALKLCPELKTIPYDFEGYREVAHKLYDTIAQYTLDIEAVSCDEMFVDLTELLQSTGVPVMDFVSFVRDEISTATGCACSAGIGANRLQARMATKKAKPNGQFRLRANEAEAYMREIPIAELPGVGPSTSHRLKQMTYVTCADLQTIPKNVLQTEFGKKFGETLYNACRGIDERPLVYDKGRKSVSVDVNYGIRFSTEQEVDRFMRQLTEEIHRRLVELRQRGKLVTVKLLVRSPEAPIETAKFMGHGLCDIVTKSLPLRQHTDDRAVLEDAVLGLMRAIGTPPCELRGIGIQISKFEGSKGAADSAAGNRLKNMLQKAEDKQKVAKESAAAGQGTQVREENTVARRPYWEADDQQPCTSRGQPAVPVLESFQTPVKVNGHSTTMTTATDFGSPREKNFAQSPGKPKPERQKGGTRGRRGRPPKWATTTVSKKEPKQTAQNGLRRFLTAADGKPSSSTSCNGSEELPPELDPDVLAALPEDIRQEAIRDYRRQQLQLANSGRGDPRIMKTPEKGSPLQPLAKREWKTPTTPQRTSAEAEDHKIKVELKFLQALPPELRVEVEKQIELNSDHMVVTCSDPEIDEPLFVTPEPSPVRELLESEADIKPVPIATPDPPKDSNILRRPNWRQLVEEWMDSTDDPFEYDVQLLAANGTQLVESCEWLERLYLFGRCFHRLAQAKTSCQWHRAYSDIVRPIQERMLALYGKGMAVQQDCGCSRCNIKTV